MTELSRHTLRKPISQIPGGEWFSAAGLGIFVHWDHASQQGIEISWPLVGGVDPKDLSPTRGVSVAQYQSSAATFNPTAWDARDLARRIREAGGTYAVFTARHHAGYAMFHTAHSDFSVAHTPSGHDLTGEFAEAMRAEGIRVGIYYSLSDWNHPDYPAFTDDDKPYPTEKRQSDPEAWHRYLDYLRGQLTELLTNYGQIDLLWFDGQWERTAEEWDAAGLRQHIKSLQPNVVINDRLITQGDYITPEQAFPVTPLDGPWELCQTMGKVWAWAKDDTPRSARLLLVQLCEVAARGGNYLLNIGPRGDGSLDPAHEQRLAEIGSWMEKHRESVIGVTPTQGVDFHGPTTARENRLYLHLVMDPVEEFVVRGVPVERVTRVYRLADGQDLDHHIHVGPNGPEDGLGEIRITAPERRAAILDVVAIDLS